MSNAIPFVDVSEDNSSTEAPVKASFWARAKARVVTIAKRIASPIKGAAVAVKTATVKAASATKRTFVKVVSKVRGVKSAKTTATSTKPSFGQRAKARAQRLAARAAFRAARMRASFSSPVSAFGKAKTWIGSTWRRAVRPFLQLRIKAFAIIGVCVALIVAPMTTLVVVFAIGAAMWLLSYGVEYLESSASPAARVTLKVIEMVAQFGKGLVYAATALFVIAMMMTSVVFAVTEVLELVLRYFNVKEAVSISAAVYFLLTGQWLWLVIMGLLWIPAVLNDAALSEGLRQRSSRKQGAERTVDQQDVKAAHANRRVNVDTVPVDISGMFDEAMRNARAKREAEEAAAAAAPRRVQLPKCTVCSSDAQDGRFSLHNHKGLCATCFKQLTEEDVIRAARRGDIKKADITAAKAAGVHLPRGQFGLSRDEICAASENHAFRHDATQMYWIAVSWWRDGQGGQHVREWFGFKTGTHVAMIQYRHERHNRGYTCYVLHADNAQDKRLGVFQTLGRAQEVIADEVADSDAAQVSSVEASFEEVVEDTSTADVMWVSPEAHIEHVRRTEGAVAADTLETSYLNEMSAQDGSS